MAKLLPKKPSIAFIIAVILMAFSIPNEAHAQDTQNKLSFRDCVDCPEMVLIQAGVFRMGSTTADIDKERQRIREAGGLRAQLPLIGDLDRSARFMAYEQPQHTVEITKPFAMGRFPVTKGEFAAFVQETGHETGRCWLGNRNSALVRPTSMWSHPGFEQSEREPVICVTYKDANAYIEWLNSKVEQAKITSSHGRYYLPSEAEWEYSARAGTQTARWWGDAVGIGNALCDGCGTPEEKILRQRAESRGAILQPCCHPGRNTTVPVGRYPGNPFGLFDMLGNVSELTQDCWHPNYVGAPTQDKPWMSNSCHEIVTRGGSYHGLPWVSRSATRYKISVDEANNGIGFRVAKTLE